MIRSIRLWWLHRLTRRAFRTWQGNRTIATRAAYQAATANEFNARWKGHMAWTLPKPCAIM